VTYKISAKVLVTAASAGAFGLLGLFFENRDQPSLMIFAAAAIVLALVWGARVATVVRADYIGRRGLLGTKKIPWRDVQDIRIEANVAKYVKDSAPKELAMVYRTNGRRMTLIHLNQKNLNGFHLVLADEVEKIRNRWLERRGADWRPVPKVQQAAATMARYGVKSWVVGFRWAISAIFVMTVVTLANDVVDPFSIWVLTLGVPAIVFVGATIVTALRRRRPQPPAVRESDDADASDDQPDPLDIAQDGRGEIGLPGL
jgi:hypothetical protein